MTPQAELKKKFIDEAIHQGRTDFRLLVKIVEKPSGALETITNAEHVNDEILYVLETYDEEFRHRHNPRVRIVGYILI